VRPGLRRVRPGLRRVRPGLRRVRPGLRRVRPCLRRVQPCLRRVQPGLRHVRQALYTRGMLATRATGLATRATGLQQLDEGRPARMRAMRTSRRQRPMFTYLVMTLLSVVGCGRGGETYTDPITGLRFVRIDRGEFIMGSPANEAGRQGDEYQHRVVLPRPFYISATEVTQAQWQAVMGGNPSRFVHLGGDGPVEQVSWDEVQVFLRRLSEKGNGTFRLPTEAEWEYACRAGTETAYAFGRQLSTARANYDGRYPLAGQEKGAFRGSPSRVASFEPNRWGVFDAHGNVWEWCADEYCAYSAGTTVNPVSVCGSKYKVIRGGSWYFGADSARSAMRYTHEPQLKGFSIGFRVVREV